MPPEGQGIHADQFQFDLTPGPETRHGAILLSDPDSTAQARPVGSRLVFRQPVRSCRRWQLTFCSAVLRGLLPPRHAPGYVRSTSKPERPRFGTLRSHYRIFAGHGSSRVRRVGRGTSMVGERFRAQGALLRGLGFVCPPNLWEPAQQSNRRGPPAQRCLRIRPFSRSQSRSFSVRRLSCCFLPLASAISTLTLPRFQYMAVGTRV